jgi:phage terminase large subunit-like protein
MLPPRTRESGSHASWVKRLPPQERAQWIQSLSPEDAEFLETCWGFWAREEQLSPWSPWRGEAARRDGLERYSYFLACAGRGGGKTRVGSETTNEEAKELGEHFRGALVARTAADIRDVMVGGESGIMQKSEPGFRPRWEPSNRRIVWPNGATAITYSADEPDQLRGPQQNYAWGDEVAAWRYPEAYDQLMFGLRLHPYPRAVFTTTPRPTALVKMLLADPRTKVIRGSTYDNAENLAPSYIAAIKRKYEGTTLGEQEVHGIVTDEAPGALWKRAQIDGYRVDVMPETFLRVVAVDPSATASEDSDEAGIVAAGVAMVAGVRHAYVFADHSGRMQAPAWAATALALHDKLRADRITAETNQGGDMVEQMIRMAAREQARAKERLNAEVTYKGVWAKEGKALRATPVHGLYEQGRVHHVGLLRDLEDQMCNWVPGTKSPDRLDAMVYAITDLVLEAETTEVPAMSLNYASMARRSPVRGR